jgi:hypothetical protein
MITIHRYLGFFLAGILFIYALSGIVLIFRDSDLFTVEEKTEVTIPSGMPLSDLGKALEIKRFQIDHIEGDIVYFKEGTYNQSTRKANLTVRELLFVLDKKMHLHKAKSNELLMFLNILFGLSLFFCDFPILDVSFWNQCFQKRNVFRAWRIRFCANSFVCLTEKQLVFYKYLCEPSQVGIRLECPQTQSWKPCPFNIRSVYCSILDVRVADCFAAEK